MHCSVVEQTCIIRILVVIIPCGMSAVFKVCSLGVVRKSRSVI